METEMDATRNPELSPVFFVEKANTFFTLFNSSFFSNKERALEFIEAFDAVADSLTAHIQSSGATYTDETILLFGSPLGEAFCKVFDGEWMFSDKQNRWVVSARDVRGDIAELNVFRKVENRIVNGTEDSISYYYAMVKNMLSGDLRP